MRSWLNGCLYILVFLVGMSNSVGAQVTPETKVKSITTLRQGEKVPIKEDYPIPVALNDTVEFTVENIDALAKPPADAAGTLPPLLPYLNGFPLKGSSTDYIDRKKGVVRFTLLRNDADDKSKTAWAPVLGGLRTRVQNVTLSFGPETGGPVSPGIWDGKFELQRFPEPWTILAGIVVLVVSLLFFVLACITSLLKDPPSSGERHYSMGRCQMAWWFLIILASFTWIWLVTGSLKMPDSSLILLGISGATALGAIVIDPNPDKAQAKTGARWGQRFLQDILSDKNGIAFHRFQIFGWTVLIGLIFISSVVNQLAQPTLDTTLLALMGISSGTYIGFKFPEKAK